MALPLVPVVYPVANLDLLIAPKWDLPKAAVLLHFEREFKRRGVKQGSAWHHDRPA